MSDQPPPAPDATRSHPEEMTARVDLRIDNVVVLQAAARATPAGLVAGGLLVAAVLLSAAFLVRTARRSAA
jgi:hypothetical protein